MRRVPRHSHYVPLGELWRELTSWYSWQPDATFEKVPIRLQPPPGKRLLVIDATDTGELVSWAGIPHRLGSESRRLTGERNAPEKSNPECTQAFTYPFAIAIHDDRGKSLNALAQVKPGYARAEHRQEYSLQGFPMFLGRSFFNYRRIVSTAAGDVFESMPAPGDITLINWNRGNDWGWMNPSLVLTDEQLAKSGQLQNWLGGLSLDALKNGEKHALLFAEWLLEKQSDLDLPLTYLTGANSPMGTVSGLSMIPYFREGRRILGRQAYGQTQFMMREADLGVEPGTKRRDFSATAIARVHYSIDIHGCRYRNWEPSQEATSAALDEYDVQPTPIPLESLIPQGVDNLLIGGKSLAVSHIVNAVTRTHYSEWSIGAAAGATAGWLLKHAPANLSPAEIVPQHQIVPLQQYLTNQGLRPQ
ncbi:FAD-dependent oxidoreductase [Kovacikia minuta CCNUW1]|uniref:FAD-dependent oxidoreductase n=1 Tax=Kovacikia minuta TaxID=2931930 RepID=UPI001CCF65F0|nr:FAD-dependent oxidoreductase [Kovacikia minuta]UBF27623.1 FAD-dependent oxidoreductase [Kovacikia minuta CCNUW1]